MTDQVQRMDVTAGGRVAKSEKSKLVKRRYAAERRFRFYGMAAIGTAVFFVFLLFGSIVNNGWSAFFQTKLDLTVHFDESVIDKSGQRDRMTLLTANYRKLAREALLAELGVDPADRPMRRKAEALLSRGAAIQLRDVVMDDPSVIGTTQKVELLASGNADALMKGAIDRDVPESRRQLDNRQVAWLDELRAKDILSLAFNTGLFTYGASSQPETAGIGVAAIGSFFMMLIVVLLAVPLGVAAALYLEEFAPQNRWTDLIEVNINNLAAVPSIVFGLLGLAVFINFAGLPRSSALVGGLVLTLMTLPTVIIATRAAIRAVPPSIREAALGVGASKMQTVTHHVLPLALPGILTGTIIGLVQALGETAPLLMIGLVAFVVDYPATPMDPATALPVQIYMWATAAERGFVERTAGATIILLGFLILMNSTAVIMRRRFERKW
ncbi:phosphate transport system permease protein [Parvibaculum indicum]|uniref:phosphate ABC transporter permease PstA n=1 Tax=Parvibaculum indicum TaxID=562969 RepID=UPI003CCCCA27|nr:phosphate transport system permease protein [Parvibaculum indicum]